MPELNIVSSFSNTIDKWLMYSSVVLPLTWSVSVLAAFFVMLYVAYIYKTVLYLWYMGCQIGVLCYFIWLHFVFACILVSCNALSSLGPCTLWPKWQLWGKGVVYFPASTCANAPEKKQFYHICSPDGNILLPSGSFLWPYDTSCVCCCCQLMLVCHLPIVCKHFAQTSDGEYKVRKTFIVGGWGGV